MKINWQLLISLLRSHGKSTTTVAKETGLSKDALGKISNGTTKRMFFEDGLTLLDYASDVLEPGELGRVRVEAA